MATAMKTPDDVYSFLAEKKTGHIDRGGMRRICKVWRNDEKISVDFPRTPDQDPEREHLRELYYSWMSFHRPQYVKMACVIGTLIMGALLPLDFLNFGQERALHYAPYRVGVMVYLLLHLSLLVFIIGRNFPARRRIVSYMLLPPPLIFNLVYMHFLRTAPEDIHSVVMVGNLMVTFFSSFLLHWFWREQYLLNGLSIVALTVMAALYPNFTSDAIQLGICHASSFIMLLFFRRRFVGSMLDKYKNLRSLVPVAVARRMTVAEGDLATDEEFKPRKRFAAVLLSDWRGYQELATKNSAEKISALFETYYDIVFDALGRCVPSGTYYADWIADELVVVFYSDTDDEKEVLANCASFASELATSISVRVEKSCGLKLNYDVGIAAGYGVLGIQGPRQRKKTTITADFAGTAKRLETEAKELRLKGGDRNAPPIVLMEKTFAAAARELGLFPAEDARLIEAETKNISGGSFVMWQSGSGKLKGKEAARAALTVADGDTLKSAEKEKIAV